MSFLYILSGLAIIQGIITLIDGYRAARYMRKQSAVLDRRYREASVAAVYDRRVLLLAGRGSTYQNDRRRCAGCRKLRSKDTSPASKICARIRPIKSPIPSPAISQAERMMNHVFERNEGDTPV